MIKMAKLKPIQQLVDDVKRGNVKSNDVVMLKLGGSKEDNPVGYIWDTIPKKPLKLYQTSGLAVVDSDMRIYEKVRRKAVNISKGDYLGSLIIGYEVIRRAKTQKAKEGSD